MFLRAHGVPRLPRADRCFPSDCLVDSSTDGSRNTSETWIPRVHRSLLALRRYRLGVSLHDSLYCVIHRAADPAADICNVPRRTLGFMFALFTTTSLPHLLTHGLPALLLVLGASSLPTSNTRCLAVPIQL